MAGGSSKIPTQTSSTVTQTNLPAYAQPYFTDLLNRAQAQSNAQYVPYDAQRLAEFTPDQLATQQAVMGLTTPAQVGTASNIAQQAGLAALNTSYTPRDFAAQSIGAGAVSDYQMGTPQSVVGQTKLTAPQMQAMLSNFSPTLRQYVMDNIANIQGSTGNIAPQFEAARTGYNPELTAFQMANPDLFGQQQVDQYMSPYQQNVTDVAKREAILDAQKTQLMQNLGAARQGTYGGARQLLAGTERERALGQNLTDIQTKGLQAAYENAQQQFERDRAAQMSAAQQNLQARLGVQQLGVQTGLQTALANLSADQQARVQNQAAILQTQGLNADQALRAALANQQTQLTVGQQNLASKLGVQALGAGIDTQMALANLTGQQQAQVQNLAAQLQTQGLNADQALRAALANQQAQLTAGQSNLQAQLQMQQLRTNANLQAAQANQQANLEAQRLAEASNQFGANLGLQSLAQANQSAQTLGSLGALTQQSNLQNLQAQTAVGTQQQQQQQQLLDQAYADFLRQRDYPVEQLSYYNSILHGLPISMGSTQTTYAPPPSTLSQVAGAGLGALSLSQLAGG